MPFDRRVFGTLADGRAVEAITLSNGGAAVEILTHGATLRRLQLPGRDGTADDVLLGFDTLEDYLADSQYLGVTVGRTANRIAGARFTLDGREITLDANEPPNHLHGGATGLHRRLWDVVALTADPPGLRLATISPDGAGGYPGTVAFTAAFTLHADRLRIEYTASTDAPTVVGMTNHAYFNLGGARSAAAATDQRLTLFADAYTPVSIGLIPTGDIAPVAGSRFDFTAERPVATSDYDENFVVRGAAGTLRPAARLTDAESGRVIEIASDAPGIQFYSGGFLAGLVGKGGRVHAAGDAVCLEPQPFPDAPNRPGFPSTRLEPGDRYSHVIEYRFGMLA